MTCGNVNNCELADLIYSTFGDAANESDTLTVISYTGTVCSTEWLYIAKLVDCA